MLSRATFLLLLPAAAIAASAATPARPEPIRGRVDFIRTVSSVNDYSKPKSIWNKLLDFVAGPGDKGPQLIRPYAVTNDSLGRILVADPGQRVVHIFDVEKRKYSYIKGRRKEEFLSPIGIAIDQADNIYVSDSIRARIYVFDKTGKSLRAIGAPGFFQRPTGLAFDAASKRLFITDTLRHQVIVVNADGSYSAEFGRRGVGPGEFNFPVSLTLSGGTLYVVDSMNFRIQALTPDGRFLSAFGKLGNTSGTFNRPKGIAADSDGHLYVVDALFETVQVFNREGQLLHFFGATGSAPGDFFLPAGIYIDPRNRIFVADSFNHRVQIFRYRREGQ
ncbi:MAG: 6-bladed beta-propeller [Acidobacteria bacterium]|nr:6-bladed beta-propeller [Acidobacteriota bacterium]